MCCPYTPEGGGTFFLPGTIPILKENGFSLSGNAELNGGGSMYSRAVSQAPNSPHALIHIPNAHLKMLEQVLDFPWLLCVCFLSIAGVIGKKKSKMLVA